MTYRRIPFPLCLAFLVFCLAAGYSLAGQWTGTTVGILTGFAWLLARKYSFSWLSHTCLFVSVVLAVGGRLLGASAVLMICSSAVALAVWDLSLLDGALGKSSEREEQTQRYWNMHLQSLTVALVCGLIMAFLGRMVSFQIPFIALIFLVALAVYGLDRIWGYIKTQSDHFS
jgi:hypothetical protein